MEKVRELRVGDKVVYLPMPEYWFVIIAGKTATLPSAEEESLETPSLPLGYDYLLKRLYFPSEPVEERMEPYRAAHRYDLLRINS
ncbi:hypothetical protein [Sabulibacter ruber]|uniref:hypothetical protein n=1 Tax=Sabulibacter ruber TaxID=2811901 RepID=UPI001A97CCE1|nr:hypothetical protein [Sabulibacter ruber]